MEVEILSRKLVKPSSPTPHNLRNLKVSSLDLLENPSYPCLILYYLDTNEDWGGAKRFADRKRKLEESLSSVLVPYYPLAGRYLSSKFMVYCNDEGVELLEAKVSCKLSQVLDGEFGANELKHLVAQGFESETSPLLHVQLNLFDCGGIAIGTSVSHRIFDGYTMSRFVNDWAIASREGTSKEPRHSFQLASELCPVRDKLPYFKQAPMVRDVHNVVTKRFVFDKEAIKSLKNKANSCSNAFSHSGLVVRNQYFSRVEVVTTLIWKALIRAGQARNEGNFRPSLLTQIVNLRGKTRLPIPKNCGGNLFIHAIAKFPPEKGDHDLDFCNLLHLIRNATTSTLMDNANLMSGDHLLMKAVEARREVGEEYDKSDICRFSSICKFFFYEADFGWDKPVWISIVNMTREMTMLMDTKDGEGVEAWLNFDKRTMLLLEQDPEIMAFASRVGA